MNAVVGCYDIALITLDTLRYDVAQTLFDKGELPELSKFLPPTGWQKRHTAGSFTYAAHHAFLAGFLPTPAMPGPHPRLFATAFRGSESISARTKVFEQESLPRGLESCGYHTLCIGGVGFFNKLTALGCVLPSMFRESHWSPRLSVSNPRSTDHQVDLALKGIAETPGRLFLFMNVSAIHSPNHFYLPDTQADRLVARGRAQPDSLQGHAAALRYVDKALARLWRAFAARGPTFVILCSDHGCAYGEDGYQGHRLGHETVWTVPYTQFFVSPK